MREDWQMDSKSFFLFMLGFIPLGLACGLLYLDSGFAFPALVLIRFGRILQVPLNHGSSMM